MSAPQSVKTYIDSLKKLLAKAKTRSELHQAIVDSPFVDPLTALDLDLGVVVLLLANHDAGTIDRVALSNTYSAKGAVRMSVKPFQEIKIPLGHKKNIIAQAIATNTPYTTTDWQYLFVPALRAEDARMNQAGAGIETSVVYPLTIPAGGALIFSCYQPPTALGKKHEQFMTDYARLASSYLAEFPSQ